MDEILPRESESQKIGHAAVRAFQAQCPMSWRPTALDGDSDVGFDFQVQVVSEQRFRAMFHVQVKGVTDAKRSSDNSFISIQLRVSTINYFKKLGYPVMLVLADMSTPGDPTSCPIFYLWILEKVDEALQRVPPDAKATSELSFRVPLENVLNRQLDVLPRLEQEELRRAQHKSFEMAIASVGGREAVPTATSQITSNISTRGGCYLDSATGGGDTPWAAANPGTLAHKLKSFSDLVTDCAIEEATYAQQSLAKAQFRDEVELAEFAFICGRLSSLLGESGEALTKYESACRLQPKSPRYLTAAVEMDLMACDFNASAVQRQLARLSQSPIADHPKVSALSARCLSVLERHDEAHKILDSIPLEAAIVERCICLTIQQRWQDVVDLVGSSSSIDIPRHSRLTLRLLAGRSRFSLLCGDTQNAELPASGPPTLDSSSLQSVWKELHELAIDFQRAGWPGNSEFLVDILAAIAVMSDHASEALILVSDFLSVRPSHSELQISRMKLAAFAENWDTAYDAASRIPGRAEKVVNQAMIAYQSGRFVEATRDAGEILALKPGACPMLPDCVAIIGHCAHRIFQRTLFADCGMWLEQYGCHDRLAVLNYVVSGELSPLERDAARKSLLEAATRMPDSAVLQDQAFYAAKASDLGEARLLIQLSEAVQRRRKLTKDELISIVSAFMTIGESERALDVLRDGQCRLPTDSTLISLRAIVLERLGRIGEARALLMTLSQGHQLPEVARSTYINIAARCGFIDEAIAQFETMLGGHQDASEKREALRGIFSLELHRGGSGSRLLELALAYGRVADHNSESEEGLYLQMVIIAGMFDGGVADAAATTEFSNRCSGYFDRFPNSNYVSAINVPEAADAATVGKLLRERVGISEEVVRRFDALRERLDRGTVAIPYSWRPRTVLPTVTSVPQLWDLTKKSVAGRNSLTFQIDVTTRKPRDVSRLTAVPILDLLSLLVITDLGLWPVVWRALGTIAVTKQTMMDIQNELGPLGYPTETLRKLQAVLRDRIEAILQPGDLSDGWRVLNDGGLGELKTVVGRNGYFYSDDVMARMFVLDDDDEPRGLCTIDLIHTGNRLGLIAPDEAGRLIAQLVRWRVGMVLVTYENLAAVIPPTAVGATNLATSIQALFNDRDFRPLVDGLWDISKTPKDIHSHVSAILARLAGENPNLSSTLIAAIWAIWFDKARLRPDVSLPPEDILSQVLVQSIVNVKDSPHAIGILWSAFFALVARLHGDRMEVGLERRSIRTVGKMVANVVNAKPEMRDKIDEILAWIRNPLRDGTAESDCFMEGYLEGRIQSERNRRN